MNLSDTWDGYGSGRAPRNVFGSGKKLTDEEEQLAAQQNQGAPPVGGGFGSTNIGAPSPSVSAAMRTPASSRSLSQQKLLKDRLQNEDLTVGNGMSVRSPIKQGIIDENIPRMARQQGIQDRKVGTAYNEGLANPLQPTVNNASPTANTVTSPGAAAQTAATTTPAVTAGPKPVGYALRQMPDGTYRGASGAEGSQQFHNFATAEQASDFYRPKTPGPQDPNPVSMAAQPQQPGASVPAQGSPANPAAAATGPTAQDAMVQSVTQPVDRNAQGHPVGSYADTNDNYGVFGMAGRAVNDVGNKLGQAQNTFWNQTAPNMGESMIRAVGGQKTVDVLNGRTPAKAPGKLPSPEEVAAAKGGGPSTPDSTVAQFYPGLQGQANPFSAKYTAPSTKIAMNNRKLGQPRSSGYQASYPDPLSSSRR